MMTGKAINKVPGMALAAKDKYVENLSTYTIVQLDEIRDRQEKLMEKKSRLAKLPDRGERIIKFHERIVNEINSRNEIEEAAAKFSDLNIASKGIAAMTAIEWSSGKSTQPPTVESVLDSDDDDDADPLKVLAQHREVKVVKVIKAEESLITPADLKEIASFAKETDDTVAGNQIELEPHAIYMCGMDAMNMNNNNYTKGKHKFMPHKTTKGNVHDVDKEKARKKGPHWENTAATPPILRNNELSVLTLQESIEIQRQQYDAMKAIQEKITRERLEARQKIVADNLELLPPGSSAKDTSAFFTTFREKRDTESDSDDEVYCDTEEYYDDEEETGGVVVVSQD